MVWKDEDLSEVSQAIESQENVLFMDLQQEYLVESLRIFYAKDSLALAAKNKESLSVETSCDGKIWEKLSGELLDSIEISDFLEIPIYQALNARYIKISHQPIPLDFKVFIRKFPGMFIANGQAGWGDRMIAILNCMAMAKYTGFKWGTLWRYRKGSNFNQTGINVINIESVEEIFAPKFIAKYVYVGKIPYNDIYGTKPGVKSLDDFLQKPYQRSWGHYFYHPVLSYEGLPKDYAKDYPSFWSKIIFSEKIQTLLQEVAQNAENLKNKIGREYFSIHIRSGDIVYNPCGVFWFDKYTPAEIAMELIEQAIQKSQAILLFGEDSQEIEALVEYYGRNYPYIYNSKEFLGKNLENETQIALQEIILMSHSCEIYTNGGSGFARLACLIGLGREPQGWSNIFSKEEQYKILKKNANKILFKPLQNSYSRMLLAALHLELFPQDLESLLRIVKEAIVYNDKVAVYHFFEIVILLASEKESEAEAKAKILVESFEVNTIFTRGAVGSFFVRNFIAHFVFRQYEKFFSLQKTSIYLNFLASKLFGIEFAWRAQSADSKNPTFKGHYLSLIKSIPQQIPLQQNTLTGATARLQSHLAYKLGNAMILNSKSLWGMIRLPYVLSYIKESHRIEQQQYQEKIKKNPELKLPPLEFY
ncbi:MAG: discoidin domain-containing protein, partial [Helicobacter sp.]|nr:discoidin domain-containing protein [Helicobacter sp.]